MTPDGPEVSSVYAYHVMRGSAERFAKDVSALDETELAAARRQADRTFALESLVLRSEEARRVAVPAEHVDAAVASVVGRYPDPAAFASGLEANRLTEAELRHALRRELWFDGVMELVASDAPVVTTLEARGYYERHRDRFLVPERCRARHILVTVNDAIAENRRDVARSTTDRIATSLALEPDRFAEFAERYSECPSALDGGMLGDVSRGQLYPELESVLFRMTEGAVSEVIETEIGYHLLKLERRLSVEVVPFSAVEAPIERMLEMRRKRERQEAFLHRLRGVRA